jgi:hypothetical protein
MIELIVRSSATAVLLFTVKVRVTATPADVSARVHFCLLVKGCLLVGMSIGTDQPRGPN